MPLSTLSRDRGLLLLHKLVLLLLLLLPVLSLPHSSGCPNSPAKPPCCVTCLGSLSSVSLTLVRTPCSCLRTCAGYQQRTVHKHNAAVHVAFMATVPTAFVFATEL